MTPSTRAQKPLKSDTQFWNDTQLTIPMDKKVDFVLTLTTRTRLNVSNLVDERWGVGWVIKANKYLSFNPFYFHREAHPPHGKPEREDRLTLGATLVSPDEARAIVSTWLTTPMQEPRYIRRLAKIHDLERR